MSSEEAPLIDRDEHAGPLPLILPGQVLAEEFLAPLGIGQEELARRLDVPSAHVGELVAGRLSMTPDLAVRLAVYFGTSVDFWINLQAEHDARLARPRPAAGD